MKLSRWIFVLFAAVVALGGAALLMRNDPTTRQTEVAAKGSQVMPFDLDRTTHRFAKTASGGVQTVIADEPTDATQVQLIRTHLTREATKFGRGDFGDPASIHGSHMPGLSELSKGYQRITTTYAEVPGGARITYTTDAPTLVTALHSWFDAQVSDHGTHAEHG